MIKLFTKTYPDATAIDIESDKSEVVIEGTTDESNLWKNLESKEML